jgi:hypothetical protein
MTTHFTELITSPTTLYGCIEDWPLLSNFDTTQWPDCLIPFDILAKSIGTLISSPGAEIENSRRVIRTFIDQRISFPLVQRTLETMLLECPRNKHFVRILCAVVAALTCINFGYRWGAIPISQEERDKTTMEFPKEIYWPWHYLNSHFLGIPDGGNTWTLAVFNTYQDPFTKKLRQKYFLNHSEFDKRTEENFNVLFADIEIWTPFLLSSLSQIWTGILREEPNTVNLGLQQLNEGCLKVLGLFRQTLHEKNLDYKTWTYKVEYPHAWGVNGGVGPSGTQLFFFQLCDRSLGLNGTSKMYQSLDESLRTAVLGPMKDIIKSIEEAPSLRQYIQKPDCPAEVVDAYNRAVETILFMRSTHKNRAGKFLNASESKMSSSNVLEKMYNIKDVLLETTFHRAMTERIDEVHGKFISKL